MNDEEKTFEIETHQESLEVSFQLASTSKPKLNNVCKNFTQFIKNKSLDFTNREKLPTQTASITTRKSPCGEGTNTWARYKLHVYATRFQIAVTHDMLAKCADFLKNTDVEIILSIKN